MAEKETDAAKKKRLAKKEAARQAIKTPKNVLAAMKQLNKEKGNHAIALEKKKAKETPQLAAKEKPKKEAKPVPRPVI